MNTSLINNENNENNSSIISLLSDTNSTTTFDNRTLYNNIFCIQNASSTNIFFILQYIMPIFTAFVGVSGNLLTILTIVISELCQQIFNCITCFRFCSFIKIILERIFKFGIRSYWINFFGQYFWNVPIYVSNLTIFLLTIERFFAVVFPLKHLKYTQFHRWKIILVILTFSFLANFNLLLVIRERNPAYVNKNNPYKYYYNNNLPLAKPLVLGPRIFISFILPLFAVFLVNFAIIFKLRARHIIQNKTAMSAETRTNNNIIFVIPLVYVLLNFPYNLNITVINFFHLHKFDCWIPNLTFLNIFYINYATNFMLYTITSSQYREVFVQLWWLRKNPKPHINNQFNNIKNEDISVGTKNSKLTID
uniref:G-protein coupled receptors family 1 profile domain-containing protein n=1 Tax=Meloidogyne enterolobii TaxID=390850 RepID=A0A6V7UJ02_MELEN|nr:unnamed protein product [Meloidogyne enterolobii]